MFLFLHTHIQFTVLHIHKLHCHLPNCATILLYKKANTAQAVFANKEIFCSYRFSISPDAYPESGRDYLPIQIVSAPQSVILLCIHLQYGHYTVHNSLILHYHRQIMNRNFSINPPIPNSIAYCQCYKFILNNNATKYNIPIRSIL